MDAINHHTFSRDVIERFLDRSWLLDGAPLPAVTRYRQSLILLDDWLNRYRAATLPTASARDVRALFKSETWDTVSGRCDSLLGLVTRFYQSLRASNLRSDDPWDAMIIEQIAITARKRVGRTANAHRYARSPLPIAAEVV